MLIVSITTSAIVAGPMKNEHNILPFNIETTRVEGTAKDASTIDGKIHSNRRADGAKEMYIFI